MDKLISTVDAQRRLLALLREIKAGHSYIVTSRGRPVARITPVITRKSPRSPIGSVQEA